MNTEGNRVVTVTQRAGWRTSTFSANGDDCFDVDFTNHGVELRHSRRKTGPVLHFTPAQWACFLDEVISGELTNDNGAVAVTPTPTGWDVRDARSELMISFTHREVDAFRLGAEAGEFPPSLSLELAKAS